MSISQTTGQLRDSGLLQQPLQQQQQQQGSVGLQQTNMQSNQQQTISLHQVSHSRSPSLNSLSPSDGGSGASSNLSSSAESICCDIESLPPPSTSICNQFSLNIKLESFQLDDQSSVPEFPVIACFDPTRGKKNANISATSGNATSNVINRHGKSGTGLIAAIVWQSPIEAEDTKQLIESLPASSMIRQYQIQRNEFVASQLYLQHLQATQQNSKQQNSNNTNTGTSSTSPRRLHTQLEPEFNEMQQFRDHQKFPSLSRSRSMSLSNSWQTTHINHNYSNSRGNDELGSIKIDEIDGLLSNMANVGATGRRGSREYDEHEFELFGSDSKHKQLSRRSSNNNNNKNESNIMDENDSNMKEKIWRVDGLQSDEQVIGHFPDFKLVSIYIEPLLINTTYTTILKLYDLICAALIVTTPDFDNAAFLHSSFGNSPFPTIHNNSSSNNNTPHSSFLLPKRRRFSNHSSNNNSKKPHGNDKFNPSNSNDITMISEAEWKQNAMELTGLDETFLKLVGSVTKPRLFLHSFNISEITLRLSLTISELPVVVGVEKTPLVLQSLSLSNVQCAVDRLFMEFLSSYLGDLLLRSPMVLGSLSLLGNPTQFIEHVGTGFRDLIEIPMDSLNDGVQAFFWGVGRGVVALAQNVSEGTFTSVSAFSESLARNIERLSVSSRDLQNARATAGQNVLGSGSNSLASGFTSGAQSLQRSIVEGFYGVFAQPSRGWREDRGWGLLRGFGTGLVGAFTRPMSGALDLVCLFLFWLGFCECVLLFLECS